MGIILFKIFENLFLGTFSFTILFKNYIQLKNKRKASI